MSLQKSHRNARIWQRIVLEGRPLRVAAAEFGISIERARQIVLLIAARSGIRATGLQQVRRFYQ